MFKIGDNIIYGVGGVMTVLDIRSEQITGEEKTYYLLCDYGKNNASVTGTIIFFKINFICRTHITISIKTL